MLFWAICHRKSSSFPSRVCLLVFLVIRRMANWSPWNAVKSPLPSSLVPDKSVNDAERDFQCSILLMSRFHSWPATCTERNPYKIISESISRFTKCYNRCAASALRRRMEESALCRIAVGMTGVGVEHPTEYCQLNWLKGEIWFKSLIVRGI